MREEAQLPRAGPIERGDAVQHDIAISHQSAANLRRYVSGGDRRLPVTAACRALPGVCVRHRTHAVRTQNGGFFVVTPAGVDAGPVAGGLDVAGAAARGAANRSFDSTRSVTSRFLSAATMYGICTATSKMNA